MQIAGTTILVTGGSSGLGAGCVRRFAAQGAQVVIADLNVAAGLGLVEELGDAVSFIETDVTDPVQGQAAVDMAASKGEFRGLVNCAGILVGRRVVSKRGPHDLESFARVITVNLIGSFNMIRLAAEKMSFNGRLGNGERGVLISTASVAAYEGQIGQAAYSASKGGIVGMMLPIARELADLGIRVNAIAPGIFDTAMLGQLPDEIRQTLADSVPFPSRLGTAEDFAKLAQHIFENEMLNGETIRLDGAVRLTAR
ncbi:MAG: SDR family NAD(P)-dependent oxidoreductase [Anaerolineales bacterium]|nr:SDR family NAD(P)-dependent oxidoreductase [Anaerolineales bacterium]